jgi:hypothetical protein
MLWAVPVAVIRSIFWDLSPRSAIDPSSPPRVLYPDLFEMFDHLLMGRNQRHQKFQSPVHIGCPFLKSLKKSCP